MKKQVMYFNVICEELSVFGGKIIHEDVNLNLEELSKFVETHVNKHPGAKWELYPFFIS